MIEHCTRVRVIASGRERVWIHTAAKGAARVGAFAADSLLAKHEQEPPSSEQPFSKYSRGEKQGMLPGLL